MRRRWVMQRGQSGGATVTGPSGIGAGRDADSHKARPPRWGRLPRVSVSGAAWRAWP
ncbi:hypothetical protein [Amycolatopsis sp. A1MSW2902]|uniref:hypothetical protein n=1 Tax=Amycolatopsis sp. A1MSW2902 TaxID=687413 RepID=UPI00307DD499